MGDMHAKTDVKEATIAAVVIRADGTTENLGVVSAYYRNPIKRAMWTLKQRLGRN